MTGQPGAWPGQDAPGPGYGAPAGFAAMPGGPAAPPPQGWASGPGYPPAGAAQAGTGAGTNWHRHPSADSLIKGLVVGAGAAYLLTNETAQRTVMRTAVQIWALLQGGFEELKERLHDAEAEVAATASEPATAAAPAPVPPAAAEPEPVPVARTGS